jgi:two-component system CheB/CheR fusion protein
LISCRNVLIYLDSNLQKRVLPILHYALNPGGYLLLGSSETIAGFTDLFSVEDQKYRIYVKNPIGNVHLTTDFSALVEAATARRPVLGGMPVTWSALDVQKEADRIVLNKYAPVVVVIDENMTVLQFRGRTGPCRAAPSRAGTGRPSTLCFARRPESMERGSWASFP